MNAKGKSFRMVKSVDHAFQLLEQFQGEEGELTLSELGRRLRLPKNNVFRLLATLESRRYIEQNESNGSYRLGLKLFHLSRLAARQMRLVNRSRPAMEAMAKQCNETVQLSILRGFSIICIDAVECDHAVRVVPRIGLRLPAHCTAAGKAQIAHLPQDILTKLVSDHKLVRHTPQTIIDPYRLQKHLQQIVRQGYATNKEELEAGIRSIAAPIRDCSSNVIGAVVLSGPITRFSDDRLKTTLIPLLKEGAADISSKFGFL